MYFTESDKTCDQTGFGWFVMYRMYRMLQACLELVDGKGGLMSLLDDSQRFETREANQKFLSSLKQSFSPPGGSGGGGATCVGAESDGYSHGCVSLPSLGWNAKRMIQRHAILNEYFFAVGCTIGEGERGTIDRGNTTSATQFVCSVPTVSFCSRKKVVQVGFLLFDRLARKVRSKLSIPTWYQYVFKLRDGFHMSQFYLVRTYPHRHNSPRTPTKQNQMQLGYIRP